MPKIKSRIAVLLFLTIPVVGILWNIVSMKHRMVASYPVMDDAGNRIASIFDRPERQTLVPIAALKRHGQPGCRSETIISRILNRLTIQTVMAADCQEGACGSPYSTPSSLACGMDCGGGYFLKYFGGGGEWSNGWKYSGAEVCQSSSGGCVCEEVACQL